MTQKPTISVQNEQDCYTIWENCLRIIQEHVVEQTYLTWFEPIVPIKLEEKVLTVQVPSQFFYEWLEQHYVHLLRKVIDETLGKQGRLEYAISVNSKEKEDESKPYLFPLSNQNNNSNKTTNTPKFQNNFSNNTSRNGTHTFEERKSSYPDFRLNFSYTFENFVEGDCNRLARSAGLAVAERPGVTSFNPLMLYGGVGLGKTHLVQAIGNHIVRNQPDRKILYVPSDKFTNQFIDSVKNNDLHSFTNFYTQVDVLVIDDVQFLAGKDRTQEIFFHIFNHLHQLGKQIVMTSDRPPKELQGLEERLLSRFKWGLTADLKQPDLETRMAIIKKKLQSEDMEIPVEVVEYIANSIDSNIRELEGAMVSLIAKATLSQSEIDLGLAKNTVQQIVQNFENQEISIDAIQKEVGEYLGISVEDMQSKVRKKEIVLARQIAMYFAKEYTEFSLKSIGYHFGGRDHSTVIHAITCINDYLEERKEVKMYVDDIRQRLMKK